MGATARSGDLLTYFCETLSVGFFSVGFFSVGFSAGFAVLALSASFAFALSASFAFAVSAGFALSFSAVFGALSLFAASSCGHARATPPVNATERNMIASFFTGTPVYGF